MTAATASVRIAASRSAGRRTRSAPQEAESRRPGGPGRPRCPDGCWRGAASTSGVSVAVLALFPVRPLPVFPIGAVFPMGAPECSPPGLPGSPGRWMAPIPSSYPARWPALTRRQTDIAARGPAYASGYVMAAVEHPVMADPDASAGPGGRAGHKLVTVGFRRGGSRRGTPTWVERDYAGQRAVLDMPGWWQAGETGRPAREDSGREHPVRGTVKIGLAIRISMVGSVC